MIIKKHDILSEASHYKILGMTNNMVTLHHYESNETVSIDKEYIDKCLKSADHYDEVIEVTREDKKDGTPGIRTIFENIYSNQVFTVVFKKQDKPKSRRAINEEINARTEAFINAIEKAKNQKKSISDVAKKYFNELILNPIHSIEEGENRVLRGYKLQFKSRDGKYRCVDLDIIKTDKETGERLVNINTISQLIYNGVKYVVN